MKLRAAAVFLCLAGVAALFRFPELAVRPMHCDEAVNADQLGVLIEHGRYEYSMEDFHGPALAYLSLVLAKIEGIRRYLDLNEVTVRAIPAFLGVLLIAAHFLLIPYLSLRASAAAGLLAAVSPVMVYYSRYYIHETLLVLLSFGLLLSIFRYCGDRRARWAVSAGILVGLMYATKETVVVVVGCMALAGVATLLVEKGRLELPPARDMILAAAAALLVGGLLMSSFLTHPRGLVDSLVAYRTYFTRAAGVGTVHVHPWSYYLGLLLYFHMPGKPVWSEALIALLAVAGCWAALVRSTNRAATVRERSLTPDPLHASEEFSRFNPTALRFIGFYAFFLLAVYSLIPYKAPWNILGFVHAEILLAGVGVNWLALRFRARAARFALAALVSIGVIHLGWLAWQGSTRYGADPANPWVYAHTGTDVFQITRRMEELVAVYPGRYGIPVQVISRENMWPLPWYLRRFTRVQWWNGVSGATPNAPVILATPDMEPALVRKLYEQPPPGQREMYMNLFDRYVELRPQVEIRGYVAKDLWDDWRQRGDSQ